MKLRYVSASLAIVMFGCHGVEDSAVDDENIDSVEQALVTDCAVLPQPATPIIFDRELVINNLGVVDDPCRTTWTSGINCGTTQGKWTFGWLMTAMSGSSDINSMKARQFVISWLNRWRIQQQPNPNSPPAAPRTTIDQSLLQPWMAASGCALGTSLESCALDLKQAPFRLLAFVNRVDLDTGTGGNGYASGAEFRVVFGALGYDPQTETNNARLSATVILEYGLPSFPPTGTPMDAFAWAAELHKLSNFVPGTAQYATQLQSITDAIVSPFAGANEFSLRGNGSMINQVRTNEVAFDCHVGTTPGMTCSGSAPNPMSAKWELRQFGLPAGCSSCSLVQQSLPNTPDTSRNLTTPINNYLINNRAAIFNGGHVMTASLNGNVSQSPSDNLSVVWASTNPLNLGNSPTLTAIQRAQVRHHFGFATCNGCHYRETQNQLETFHVAPRDEGQVAPLSQFLRPSSTDPSSPLATTTGGVPTNTLTVTEATNSSWKWKYNEPWRRACEIRRLLAKTSTKPFTQRTGHAF